MEVTLENAAEDTGTETCLWSLSFKYTFLFPLFSFFVQPSCIGSFRFFSVMIRDVSL